jgi:hypothetical protein
MSTLLECCILDVCIYKDLVLQSYSIVNPVLLLTPIALSVKDNKNFLMSRTAFLRKLDAEHSTQSCFMGVDRSK